MRPRRDRQGRPRSSPRARRRSSAPASSRYRVAWRDEQRRAPGARDRDPTALLHQLTSAALARGEALRDLSVTRPTLEDVYLELTADAAERRSARD